MMTREEILQQIKVLEAHLADLPQSDHYAEEAWDLQDEIDELKEKLS